MAFKTHIFLTGFMGSGKTTLGRKLAGLLHCNCIDFDDHISRQTGMDIVSIFDTMGEAAFRQMETNALQEVTQQRKPLVVALGGGTICSPANLQTVRNSGLLVYIALPPQALADRLTGSKTVRPLLKNLSGEALTQAIAKTLEIRKKFYEQAHITVNGLNLSAQQLREQIAAFQENTT